MVTNINKIRNWQIKQFLLMLIIFIPMFSFAQISIISSTLNSMNVSPRTLCEVNIMNNGMDMQIYIEAKLYNPSNELILNVRTNPFNIKNGLNTSMMLNFGIQSFEYGSSMQASYVKSFQSLPSGKFQYCCVIKTIGQLEEYGDEYCDEIESDIPAFLFLISPFDGEETENLYPIFIWNHSEPFNVTPSGECYRLVMVELAPDQNAESGVQLNTPLVIKNGLISHQIQYPLDAKVLENDKRYGWQVQRVTNGVVSDASEAWEFSVVPKNTRNDIKYAAFKKQLDGSYYMAINNKVFFKIDETYPSDKITCIIYNTKQEQILPKVKMDVSEKINLKQLEKKSGYNLYEIDLNELKITKGMYTLKVKTAKGEEQFLKFYVE